MVLCMTWQKGVVPLYSVMASFSTWSNIRVPQTRLLLKWSKTANSYWTDSVLHTI
jgi:hypothetical protein